MVLYVHHRVIIWRDSSERSVERNKRDTSHWIIGVVINRSGAYDIWNDDDDGFDEHLKKRRLQQIDFENVCDVYKLLSAFIQGCPFISPSENVRHHKNLTHMVVFYWGGISRCGLFAEMSFWLVWTTFNLTLINGDWLVSEMDPQMEDLNQMFVNNFY